MNLVQANGASTEYTTDWTIALKTYDQIKQISELTNYLPLVPPSPLLLLPRQWRQWWT